MASILEQKCSAIPVSRPCISTESFSFSSIVSKLFPRTALINFFHYETMRLAYHQSCPPLFTSLCLLCCLVLRLRDAHSFRSRAPGHQLCSFQLISWQLRDHDDDISLVTSFVNLIARREVVLRIRSASFPSSIVFNVRGSNLKKTFYTSQMRRNWLT